MPVALYVGDDPTFELDGYHVYAAGEEREALGAYVFFLPHVIIFDAHSPHAHAAFTHLADVTDKSPHGIDVMIVLDANSTWETHSSAMLVHATSDDDLPELADMLMQQREEGKADERILL